MDEKTETLIRALAEKLGTTAEHLWMALVKQAPITAAVDLLVLIGWAAACFWVVKKVAQKTKEPSDGYAEWRGEGAFFAWAGAAMLCGLTLLIGGASLSGIVAGFVNPEYWALKEVMK